MAKREINEVTDTRNQLADHLTEATASSETLCDVLQQGNIRTLKKRQPM